MRGTRAAGLTLIETLIVVGLTALAAGALAALFAAFSRLSSFENAEHGAATAAGATIAAALALAAPADQILASHTFVEGSYTSGASALVVEMPSVTSSGVIVAGHYDYGALYLSSGNAYELIDADAASARRAGTFLLGPLSALSFTYDSGSPATAHQVTVAATSNESGGHATSSVSLSETIRPQNLQ